MKMLLLKGLVKMISFFILIFSFAYSISLFLIDNLYILGLFFIFNIALLVLIKVPLKKHICAIKKNLLFVTFIILCNVLFSDVLSSIKVGIRLFIAIEYTYIISCYFDTNKIRTAFLYLLWPLKLFNIDIDSMTLSICIALTFIPILIDEATMIKLSLKSKGFTFSFRNVITRPHIYLITYLNNLFDRLDELEKSLNAKGY